MDNTSSNGTDLPPRRTHWISHTYAPLRDLPLDVIFPDPFPEMFKRMELTCNDLSYVREFMEISRELMKNSRD